MATNIIARTGAEALIRDQLVNTIQQDVPKSSIVMQLATRLANMTSNQTKIPVLSMLPLAYWVNGDTGMKQTSKQEWKNVTMTAAELAVIVPIPEAVLADSSFDIMGEVQPRVREAMAAKVDGAIFFGNDKPTEWTTDILTQAAANKVVAPIDYAKLLGDGGMFAKVEEGGFGVDAVVGAMSTKAQLRGLLDTNGRPLFRSDMQGATNYALDGAPLYFPENGSFDATKALMIAGNFKKIVYSIRQDVTVKILDQGVIQDPSTKEIVYNLAQQDMIALRVVMRMGWALPNPSTRMNTDGSKVPFSYIAPGELQAGR
nr:MAG TPA: major capsid protein [Caudoviricetes sp.]